MIAPVDGGRPLSDRFIDRLLGWWDTGGGRNLRRALRDGLAAGRTKLITVITPALKRPLVAKSVEHLAAARRWTAKAFASDVPPTPPPRRDESCATGATEEEDAPIAPRPAVATRSATAEIRPRPSTVEIRGRTGTAELRPRTGTVEIRPGTAELRPRTAPATIKPVITTVSAPQREPI
ncbi:MAG TPA: hypothetical protein VHX44_09040, partial [Planctomycetota bacterium]|nr:hypothetical protein [Planctomycetota bacterium]